MNIHRAQKEARRRWGPLALVLQDRFGECRVGVKSDDGARFLVAGVGMTFAEAFDSADKRITEATEAQRVQEEAQP